MISPNFLISDYINKYENLDELRTKLFKQNIMTKDYVEDNIVLIYHKFDQPTNTDLERECRSMVLDRVTKKIISYGCETPLVNQEASNYMLLNDSFKRYISRCYEGTLLSVFYHNDKWYISTRRCLNSQDSVWGSEKKSHYQMFMEVLHESGYETFEDFGKKLDINNCYYFVLVHNQNKNIVDYSAEFGNEYKKLCLTMIRNKESQCDLELSDFVDMCDTNIFLAETFLDLEEFEKMNNSNCYDLPPKTEGLIVKMFDTNTNKYKLLKFQTINYQFAKSTGFDKNIFIGLIHLYQKGKLADYLRETQTNLQKIVNPFNLSESYDTVGTIDAVFKVCTSELFELFKLVWDIRNGSHNVDSKIYGLLPKEYKTILFGIKGLYYKKKAEAIKTNTLNYLQIKDIYLFLKSIPTEQICGLLKMRKLMFNWCRVNQDLQEFTKISHHCDKVHIKLMAIYCNKLFPNIVTSDLPPTSITENT